MAGRGKAPKYPEERRNRADPRRGEWIDIPAKNPKKPPAMPRAPRGGWNEETRKAWRSWWADGVSTQWGPADEASVRLLSFLHHDLEGMDAQRGKSSLAGEVRQRLDGLGLTMKGKRDLRFRVVAEVEEDDRQPRRRPSRYSHLRAVNE